MNKHYKICLVGVLALLSSACASLPRGYEDRTFYKQVSGEEPGLQIRDVQGAKYSTFVGNSYTPSEWAFLYSKLGAYEACAKQGKFAFVGEAQNYSQSSSYTQVGSYTTGGYNGIPARTNVYSYPVTTTVPAFISHFSCSNQFHGLVDPLTEAESIGRDLVSPFTKDFKGGILVRKISEKSELKVDDVIIRVRQKRVSSINEFYAAIDQAPTGSTELVVIRGGKTQSIKVRVQDTTQEFQALEANIVEAICSGIRADVAARLKEVKGMEQLVVMVKANNQEAISACETVEGLLKSKAKK